MHLFFRWNTWNTWNLNILLEIVLKVLSLFFVINLNPFSILLYILLNLVIFYNVVYLNIFKVNLCTSGFPFLSLLPICILLVCALLSLLNKCPRAHVYCAPGPAMKTAIAFAGPADLTTIFVAYGVIIVIVHIFVWFYWSE